jgi:hypothetical protein
MTISPNLTSTASAFVKIIPSDIIVNLIQFGTPMITSGHEQDLKLDPGTYSVDLDENKFNASVSNIYNMNLHLIVFDFVFDRIGNMNIIVEFMVYISSLI